MNVIKDMKQRSGMKRYLILIVFFAIGFGSFSSFAQKEEISYFFKEIPQLSHLNPAMSPNSNFFITIGMPSLEFNTSGFCYHDVINRHPEYPDSLRIDIDGFMNKLKRNNYVAFDYEQNLLGFGFKAGKNYFSFETALTVDTRFSFSRGAFDLVVFGTDVASGEAKLFDGDLLELNAYLSAAVGYAREINDKLTIGVRAKLLKGLANVHTKNTSLSLHFNENNEIMARGEIDLQTSNIFGLYEITSLFANGATQNFELNSVDQILNDMTSNLGMAFDVGATYRFNDHMEAGISVSDIGMVNWDANCEGIKTMNPGMDVSFEGVEAPLDSLGSSLSGYLETVVDSLKAAFDIHSVDIGSYSTVLPMKIKASYTLRFAGVNYLHVLANTKFWNGNMMDTRLSLFYALRTKPFSISVGNTIMSSSVFNPSALMSITAGGPSLHLGASFRTAGMTSFNVADMSGFSVFFGLSWRFGNKSYWKK